VSLWVCAWAWAAEASSSAPAVAMKIFMCVLPRLRRQV
jgi:hypothetical protein